MMFRIRWASFCLLHTFCLVFCSPHGPQSSSQQLPSQSGPDPSNIPAEKFNKKPIIPGERAKWQDLARMYGKRSDWNNLSGMWGKREDFNNPETALLLSANNDDKKSNWDKLHGMWGKKSDWNNLSGMWGKKSDWNNLNGMWGKRSERSGDPDDSEKRNNWNDLSGMWGKRNNWNGLSGMWGKRHDWNNLSNMWGKRYSPEDNTARTEISENNNNKKSDWNNLSGMWGKKNDWNNLSGMWGKRSDWNNLAGMWGKRVWDEAELAEEGRKRTQWNNLNGMWGKRSDSSAGWRNLVNPDNTPANTDMLANLWPSVGSAGKVMAVGAPSTVVYWQVAGMRLKANHQFLDNLPRMDCHFRPTAFKPQMAKKWHPVDAQFSFKSQDFYFAITFKPI